MQTELDFSGTTYPTPRGATYEPALDDERLERQLDRVIAVMADGAWHTLAELSAATGAPEASASARLRDMRRAGIRIDRQRQGDPRRGVWIYRARRAP